MSSVVLGLLGIAGLLVMLLLRVPVAIALIVVSWFGLWATLGITPALSILQTVPFEFVSNWTLSAVPMFLLMGYVGYHSGLTTSLFNLAKVLLWRLPGSLAISSIAACSGFAAVCGSSLACASAMGRIAIPEMVDAKYDRNFACGTVAAGGTIGALIPPSIPLIVFGVFTQTSVVDLFFGGIGVGLATAVGYSAVILAMSALYPAAVPRRLEKPTGTTLGHSLVQSSPVLLLIVVVFGGLLAGLFTTTEAGGIGAAMIIVIALVLRRLDWTILLRSLQETAMTCAGLFIIAIGATMFTRFLSISGTGAVISGFVDGMNLGYWELMTIITLIYLVLGMFMDPLGAMLITIPIFVPIVNNLGMDNVWFGVFLVKLLEIGMITPPFGLNVFIIKGVVGNLATLSGIFRGIMPFLISEILVVAVIVIWPDLVMMLPRML